MNHKQINYSVEELNELLAKVENFENIDLEDINKEIISHVNYEMFGAIGDGITDDGKAIYNAHVFANANKLPIIANGSKTYFIKEIEEIPIKTNVNWNGAHFIIDEGTNTKSVFKLESSKVTVTDVSNIEINMKTRIISQLAGYGNCLVHVKNLNKNQYIRKGSNANGGEYQADLFRIDNKGTLLNDVMWDFDSITEIELFTIDKEQLILENGHFTSIENTSEVDTAPYYYRGIECRRSNVLIRNCSHNNINNVDELGGPSLGFFYFWGCANINIENITLNPRFTRYYSESSSRPGTARGSYEIRFDKCCNIIIDKVTVDNFNTDYWGCHTSNYCKDMIVINSTLNRIDAHQGIYNLTVRDCILGHQGVRVVGKGSLILDNCTVYSDSCLTLRSDYGSTWEGSISLTNIIHKPSCTRNNVRIIYYNNTRNWDFGYDCYLCKNLIIENYLLDDSSVDYSNNAKGLYIFANYYLQNDQETTTKYFFPSNIKLRNIKTRTGKGFYLFDGYLYCLSGLSKHNYSVVEADTENTGHDLLDLKCNCFIDIYDVEFYEYSKIDYTYYSCNLIRDIGLGNKATDDYLNEKDRLILDIKINSCRNVFANILGLPCKLTIENSVIRSLNAMQQGSRSVIRLQDCIVYCQSSTLTKDGTNCIMVRFNGKSSSIINTIFRKPIIDDIPNLSINDFTTIYPFLYFKTTSNKSGIFNVGNFTGCYLEGFTLEEISSAASYYNLNEFGNLKHKYYPRVYGSTEQRPTINDGVYNGFTYFDTTLNKQIIFINNSWIS